MAPRRALIAASIFALATATAGDPALTWLHALDHLGHEGAAHQAERHSDKNPEGEAQCELCQFLSRNRDVLAAVEFDWKPVARVLRFTGSLFCPSAPVLARRAPASPRAPPLG